MKTVAYLYLGVSDKLYYDLDTVQNDNAFNQIKYPLKNIEFKVEIDLETGEYKVLEIDIGNGQNKFYEGEKQ